MLNSKQQNTIYKLSHALFILALFTLYSCLPTATTSKVNSGNTTNPGTGTPNTGYPEPTYPLSGIFIQEGTTQTNANLTLPITFNDSFLIRGLALSKYLRTIPVTTKICLVGRYAYNANKDNVLILSAKPKAFTDLSNKTTEFYLQVQPSNDSANQNDCLVSNLTNVLYSNSSKPAADVIFNFSYTQVCASCSTSATSTGLKLYFINGEEIPALSFNSLLLTISGNTSSGGNQCSESTVCQAQGYDCCLEGQCVKERAIRPSAYTAPGFPAAQADVVANPSRYILYPQFYFVCGNSSGTTSGGTTGGSTTNPDYEAAVRLREMKQLHDCLNKTSGEFSYCTLKYTGAHSNIPGDFAASTNGYYDDINFSTLNPNYTGDYANNIVKVIYAGVTLYEQGVAPTPDGFTFLTHPNYDANDDLTTSQGINVTKSLPVNAQDSNLYITYKVDGTCEKISTSLAKCSKTYIQASSNADKYLTTWHDNTKSYKLPSYADKSSSCNIIVKINDSVVAEDSSTWTKNCPSGSIDFNASYPIYQNQKVEITYYVNSNIDALTKLRTLAQTQVNSMCTCAASEKCNLTPIYDTNSGGLTNFECSYPSGPVTEPPVNQTVYVSSKNMPHRYFDTEGVSYDENTSSASAQEVSTDGKNFSYTDNNLLKPSNLSNYTGFNEIYGSFAGTGTYTAKPAKLVRVKKSTKYDISVNTGSFSSCANCGTDYYNSLQRIFPTSFGGGGGYTPDMYTSSRQSNTGTYRSDDLLFGRACFVPATMIPWTHVQASSARDQRRSRLAAQHFLFANGYQRDWFGFDYGSVIGSFDGVTWFSVGNQRRITATGTKLYLAVNAYYGDLSVASDFSVSVSETSSYSTEIPDHDTETGGAQCQLAHYCSTDNDCVRQLGYDYSCQSVTALTTPWPQFDTAGTEIIGSTTKTISSLVGGSNGQAKRCVYRGRGAPCLSDLNQSTSGSTFNGSSLIGTLSCSPNNSCASTGSARFSDRISRFGTTLASQNTAEVILPLSDLVGQGARLLGRPLNFYGTTPAPSAASSTLSINNVRAVCAPGTDINSASTTYELNSRLPGLRTDSADKFFGVGTTSSYTTSAKALNACPVTNTAGNFLHLSNVSLSDSTYTAAAITQNLSSNLLDLSPLTTQGIYSSNNDQPITAIGYQKNACLRAPGASCFTDMECAPSNFIASKAKTASLASVLNIAEDQYWQEDLVCGNSDFKYVSAGALNPNYDIKKNVCCREIGKVTTVYTQTRASAYKWCDITPTTKQVRVAGVNIPSNSPSRYSKVHTVYDQMTCDTNQISSSKKFAMAIDDDLPYERMRQILGQFKTLDAINQKTCCTQNWVRSFASDNGGGHAFANTKMQNIDKAMFKHVSWRGENNSVAGVVDAPFECDPNNFTNVSCEIKSLTATEQTKYLTWAGSLELMGIPQVAVMTNDQVHQLVDNNQNDNASSRLPLIDSSNASVMADVGVTAEDFLDSSGNKYYSAASYSKFNMNAGKFKKVFSESEFNCCIPSGKEIPDTATADQCCTGNIGNNTGVKRCCLPDFTNLTVYLNRYVSSEGRGLTDSAYDMSTGYIKDPAQVQLLAQQKNLCCSGKVMTGVAISKLSIPLTGGTYIPATSQSTTTRFNYRTDEVDNNPETGSIGTIFDAGVRWNNHVYCVPSSFGN